MSLLSEVNSIGRIVGGTPAAEGRFDFHATALQEGEVFCGGSLIAPNVVLTSARCGEGRSTHVALGCVNTTDLSDCEFIKVKNSSIFEDYDAYWFYKGDFQLLVLEEDSVQAPVALAAPGFDLLTGQDLTVIGRGAINPDTKKTSEGILLEANVEVVSQESCDDQYRDTVGIKDYYEDYDGDENAADNFMNILYSISTEYSEDPELDTNVDNTHVKPFNGTIVDETRFCASADGRDACDEDYGGPIFLRCDATGQDLQVGVISFGFGCAYNGIPRTYASVFYSKAFAYIERVVASQGHSLKTVGSTAEFCVVGGTQPAEELSDPPTPFPTFEITGWTCSQGFFATKDGCDCNCGIPDPDCEFTTDNIFNCEKGQICVGATCVFPGDVTTSPTLTPTLMPSTFPTKAPSSEAQSSETDSPTSQPQAAESDSPTSQGTKTESPSSDVVSSAPTSEDNSDTEGSFFLDNKVLVVVVALVCLILGTIAGYFSRSFQSPASNNNKVKDSIDSNDSSGLKLPVEALL